MEKVQKGSWPAPSSIQRGLKWTQLLKRLFLACHQIFSFFPLSSFSFYTVQYRRVQYSTVIGQLPRVSTEDRVVSVFEPFVLCLIVNFLIFSSFILLFLYSTVQKSAVQYSIRPNLEFIYKIIAVIIYIYTSCEWIAIYGPVQYSTALFCT